jgi:hypothetical protein
VLVYRVFPYRPSSAAGEAGHPLYVHPDQGLGRWDNRDLYRAMYFAGSPSGAAGETFAHLSTWSAAMLPFPSIEGAVRALGTYRFDEEAQPLLDLDDPRALLDRALRPTEIIVRNRPRTQRIARDVFAEGRWSGLSWWSMHRPQWTLHLLWDVGIVSVEDVQPLPRHPGLRDAARLLARDLDDVL